LDKLTIIDLGRVELKIGFCIKKINFQRNFVSPCSLLVNDQLPIKIRRETMRCQLMRKREREREKRERERERGGGREGERELERNIDKM
jgi:hypothetical protein